MEVKSPTKAATTTQGVARGAPGASTTEATKSEVKEGTKTEEPKGASRKAKRKAAATHRAKVG